MTRAFFDSNILLYTLGDDEKADTARECLNAGGSISVQCLNELASVAFRKFGLCWAEIAAISARLRTDLAVVPLTVENHVQALRLAETYRINIYDTLIVAAALEAGCDTLYSEDMHHGLVIDGRLTITNPFRA